MKNIKIIMLSAAVGFSLSNVYSDPSHAQLRRSPVGLQPGNGLGTGSPNTILPWYNCSCTTTIFLQAAISVPADQHGPDRPPITITKREQSGFPESTDEKAKEWCSKYSIHPYKKARGRGTVECILSKSYSTPTGSTALEEIRRFIPNENGDPDFPQRSGDLDLPALD